MKLECLSQAGLSSLVKCLWVRPSAHARVEHLKDASLSWAQALQANIAIVWKGLPGTNTLAY